MTIQLCRFGSEGCKAAGRGIEGEDGREQRAGQMRARECQGDFLPCPPLVVFYCPLGRGVTG